MFLSLFFVLSLIITGLDGLPQKVTTGWKTKDYSEVIEGNSLVCEWACYGMWQDGDCVNSGEHYWKLSFEDEVTLQAVQLTNKEKFDKNVGYGDKFRQKLKAGSTVGILASFSNGKLKAFLRYDNQTLGQIFDMDTSALSSACPAVKLGGPGRVTITKEEIPRISRKDPKNVVEFEGQWDVYPENIKIGDKPMSMNTFRASIMGRGSKGSLATLSVAPMSNSTVGQYIFDLEAVNEIAILMRVYEGSWRSTSGAVSTRMAGTPDEMELEHKLTDLIQIPDSVGIISGNIVLSKDNMTVTFVRKTK